MTSPGSGPALERPDPTTQRRILEVMAAPGPTGPGDRIVVDPERADEVIERLKAVALDMWHTEQGLFEKLTFPSPSADAVSVNMTEQAAVMAHRAVAFLKAWREQIAETVLRLEAQLELYRAAESDNRDRFV